MSPRHNSTLANKLVKQLLAADASFKAAEAPSQIHITGSESEIFTLDMTPFFATPAAVTAQPFFDGVQTVSKLLSAYHAAKSSLPFETDLPQARESISDYANEFLTTLLTRANTTLSDAQATLIAAWVKNLDVYCAVKAVESFCYSQADLMLLEIAPRYGWDVVYDHMAIRCGSQSHQDAERIATLLIEQHGYVTSQCVGEAYYQFTDGWNAYPLYKILQNGQVLRLFIDQSDAADPAQIIQHWNRVYGYTAHHFGIRATKLVNGVRLAVPLDDLMHALVKEKIKIMTPVGHYTHGLLLQVFTQPEKNSNIPAALKAEVVAHAAQLEKSIENAKLLELVSRREMEPRFAWDYFELYGLKYDPANALHSAPYYQYFLPTQAAHVIKTSQVVE